MASPTSRTKRPIPLATFGAKIARRIGEIGAVEVPRNQGSRRTESKRALLEALDRADAAW